MKISSYYWLLLGLPLMLSGCAAAAVEAISAEAVAATAEGAFVAESAGAAEMAAARAAAGGAVSEAGATGAFAEGAPVARLLVSEPLLPYAEEQGVLQGALRRLTADGTRTAVLGVDGNGVIRAGLEPLAQFRGTGLYYNNELIGELSENILYDLRAGGSRTAVAELDGVVRGRVLIGPDRLPMGSSDLMVEVTEIRNGFYHVRLAGEDYWLPAEFVALALLGTDTGSCRDERGSLVLHSGALRSFEGCSFDGEVYQLRTADGWELIDKDQVRKIIPGQLAANAIEPALTLRGGSAVFGRAEDLGDMLKVDLPSGRILYLDRQQVAAS